VLYYLLKIEIICARRLSATCIKLFTAPRSLCPNDSLGRRYHREMLLSWPLNRYPQLIAGSEAFIRRYGTASVFLAGFTAVVRAFVPLVAGILKKSPGRFYAANVLSALIWAPIHVFPGVLAAIVLSIVGAGRAQLTLVVVVGAVLLSAGSGFVHGWTSKRPPGQLLALLRVTGRWPSAKVKRSRQ
jgi:SNARE associated Golgi protein